jgi:hypothetical protein
MVIFVVGVYPIDVTPTGGVVNLTTPCQNGSFNRVSVFRDRLLQSSQLN